MKLLSGFRALLVFSKSLRSIARSLESLEVLYRLDCASRGIVPLNPNIADEVEVLYEAKLLDPRQKYE